MNATYLFLDNEMGGVELDKVSLLTTYLLACDADFNPVDDLYLYVKPDDGIYHVTGQAMNVNRIDLKIHDTIAIPYKEAGTKLYKWLDRVSNQGKIKLVNIGHGIYGDLAFIHKYLLGQNSWEKFNSYRKLDTQAVAQFLKACGFFSDSDFSGSMESICKYFGIPVDENKLHDAKYDTEKTREAFLKLRQYMLLN